MLALLPVHLLAVNLGLVPTLLVGEGAALLVGGVVALSAGCADALPRGVLGHVAALILWGLLELSYRIL